MTGIRLNPMRSNAGAYIGIVTAFVMVAGFLGPDRSLAHTNSEQSFLSLNNLENTQIILPPFSNTTKIFPVIDFERLRGITRLNKTACPQSIERLLSANHDNILAVSYDSQGIHEQTTECFLINGR